jgi:hypothetical protein
MLLQAPSTRAPPRISELRKNRDKANYAFYRYAKNAINRAYRKKEYTKESERQKAFSQISDITEEDDIDIEDELVHYKQLKLGFPTKNTISALVSGVPAPPDPPNRHLAKTTLLTQYYYNGVEESLQETKKLDETYFKNFKQQQKQKKLRAKFEAHLDNIFFTVGGQLVVAGFVYVVGPFIIPYLMSGMASSASGVAAAASNVHALSSQIATIQNARGILGNVFGTFKQPTPEEITAFLSSNPGATADSAPGLMERAFYISKYLASNPGKTTEAGSIVDAAMGDLGKLTSDRDSAIRVLNTAQQSLTKSKGWRTYAARIVSEVFLGMNPMQIQQMEQLMTDIQAQTINLIKKDPEIAADPSRIFEIAFEGNNPLTAGMPGFESFDAADLARYRQRRNDAGILTESVPMKEYQKSVLNLTNFLTDIALGPLVGHFLKFDTNLVKPLDPSQAAKDIPDIARRLRENPNWKPNELESLFISMFAPETGLSPETIISIIQGAQFIQGKASAVMKLARHFNRYKSQLKPIYALFFPPSDFQPEVREPFMRQLWTRAKSSASLRNAFSEFFLGFTGLDKLGMPDITPQPPASLDTTAGRAPSAPAPPGTAPPGTAPPGTAPPPTAAEARAPSATGRILEVDLGGSKIRPPGAAEADESLTGYIKANIYFFLGSFQETISPKNLVGYATSCLFDAGMNTISAVIENYLPEKPVPQETEEDRERKREEQEAYEQGLHDMRVMYLRQGIKGEPLMKLMRDHAMRTKGMKTLDEENMSVLEYTFAKIQRQATELSNKGLPGTIFFFWSSSAVVSLMNEMLSFNLRPSARGDGLFGKNASITNLDYYNWLCKPMVDLLIGYLQSTVSTALAELTQTFQSAYRKIYSDIYTEYIRKPFMNSSVVNYINRNIRRKLTDVTARVLNRIYLGVYISAGLNMVIDLVFDTFLQIIVNAPEKGVVDLQTFIYKNYKEVSFAGFKPLELSQYTIPTGWESIVQSLDGTTLTQYWSRLQTSLADSGYFGEDIRTRYILSSTADGTHDGIVDQYTAEGYASLEEPLGTDYRELYKEQEQELLTFQDRFRVASWDVLSITETQAQRNARMRVPLADFQGVVDKQIKSFLAIYNDPKRSAEEKGYVYQRLQLLIAIRISNAKELDRLDGKSDTWKKLIKKGSQFTDLPTALQQQLLGMNIPMNLVNSAMGMYDVTKIKATSGASFFTALLNVMDRPLLDTVYSMTRFATGKRRYDHTVALNIGGDKSIVLQGNEMKTFNDEDKKNLFIAQAAEKYFIDHRNDLFDPVAFDEYVRDMMLRSGYVLNANEVPTIVRRALQRYATIKLLTDRYSTLEYNNDDQFQALIASTLSDLGISSSDPNFAKDVARDVKGGFDFLNSKNIVPKPSRLPAELIRDLCRHLRINDIQALRDSTLSSLIPGYLKSTARRDRPPQVTGAVAEPTGAAVPEPSRRSLAHYKYVLVGGSQYYKVEEISREEAMRSQNPMERFLNVRLTPVDSKDIPPEEYRRMRGNESYNFKTLKDFQNAAVDYLLGDYAKTVNTAGLFKVRTQDSFGLFGNMFVTTEYTPADATASENLADGVFVLLGGSNGGASVNKDSDLYRRLDREAKQNPTFAASLTQYMSIPSEIESIDREIETIIAGWDPDRKRAHEIRMQDYNAGISGRIDADLVYYYLRKEELQRALTDSYHAAMNSLSKDLQRELGYNRDRALNDYLSRLDALINTIDTKDLPAIEAIVACDGGTEVSRDIEAFKNAFTEVNTYEPPTGTTFTKPDNLAMMADWIETAKNGCVPSSDIATAKQSFQDLRQRCLTARSLIEPLIGIPSGHQDLRDVFQRITELENARLVYGLNTPQMAVQNTNFQDVVSNIRSNLPTLLEAQGGVIGLKAKQIDTDTKSDATTARTSARDSYYAIPANQRRSEAGPYKGYDSIITATQNAIDDTVYTKKPDETVEEYLERMRTALTDANGRKTSLGSTKLTVGSTTASLAGGSRGFAALLTHVSQNRKNYDLSGVPDLRTTYKDSVLLTSEATIFDALLLENDALRGKASDYNVIIGKIQKILDKYKGVQFGAELTEDEKTDFTTLRSLLDGLDKGLQGDLNDFATGSGTKINEAKESHRTKVAERLAYIEGRLPTTSSLNEEISRVSALLDAYRSASGTDTISDLGTKKAALQDRLTYLQLLRENINTLRTTLGSLKTANTQGVVDLTSLNRWWDESVDGLLPNYPGKLYVITHGMPVPSFESLIDNFDGNRDTYETDYGTYQLEIHGILRTRYLEIQRLGRQHLDGLKDKNSPFHKKWDAIYKHFLQKYGTKTPDGGYGEPLQPNTPDSIVAMMRKARAYLDIGRPEDRDDTLRDFFSFDLPAFDEDSSHIGANLGILEAANDILRGKTSDYPRNFDYLDAESYMQDDIYGASDRRASNRAGREASRRDLAKDGLDKDPRWAKALGQVEEVSSDKRTPFRTRFDTLSDEYIRLSGELKQVKTGKKANGSSYTPSEVSSEISRISGLINGTFTSLDTLITDLTTHISTEERDLLASIPLLIGRFDGLRGNDDPAKTIFGKVPRIEGYVGTASDVVLQNIKTQMADINSEVSKWSDDKNNRDPSLSSVTGLRAWVASLDSKLTALEPIVDTKLTSEQAKYEAGFISDANTGRDNAITRYRNMVSQQATRVMEFEADFDRIKQAFLRSPNDFRIQSLYYEAEHLLEEAKAHLRSLENANVNMMPPRKQGESIRSYLDRIQSTGFVLFPRKLGESNNDYSARKQQRSGESDADYLHRIQQEHTMSFTDFIANPWTATTMNDATGLNLQVDILTRFLNGKTDLPNIGTQLRNSANESETYRDQLYEVIGGKLDTDKSTRDAVDDVRAKKRRYDEAKAGRDWTTFAANIGRTVGSAVGITGRVSLADLALTPEEQRLFDEYEGNDKYTKLIGRIDKNQRLLDFLKGASGTLPSTENDFMRFFDDPANGDLASSLIDFSKDTVNGHAIEANEADRLRDWLTDQINNLENFAIPAQRAEVAKYPEGSEDRARAELNLSKLQRLLRSNKAFKVALDNPGAMTETDRKALRQYFASEQRRNRATLTPPITKVPSGSEGAPGVKLTGPAGPGAVAPVAERPEPAPTGGPAPAPAATAVAEPSAKAQPPPPPTGAEATPTEKRPAEPTVAPAPSMGPTVAPTAVATATQAPAVAEVGSGPQVKTGEATGEKIGETTANPYASLLSFLLANPEQVQGPGEKGAGEKGAGEQGAVEQGEGEQSAEEGKDKPQSPSHFLQGDIGRTLYNSAREALGPLLIRYHQKDGDPQGAYDFSFAEGKNKKGEDYAPGGVITSTTFKNLFVRELAIDMFFEKDKDGRALRDDKAEMDRIRQAARSCIDIDTLQPSVSCNALGTDDASRRIWTFISDQYRNANKDLGDPGANNLGFLADVYTRIIFQDLRPDTKVGTAPTLYVGSVAQGLKVGEAIESGSVLQTDPSKAKDLNTRTKYFVTQDRPEGKQATWFGAAANSWGNSNRVRAGNRIGDLTSKLLDPTSYLPSFDTLSDIATETGLLTGFGLSPQEAAAFAVGRRVISTVVESIVLPVGELVFQGGRWLVATATETIFKPDKLPGETNSEFRARMATVAGDQLATWWSSANAKDMYNLESGGSKKGDKPYDMFMSVSGNVKTLIVRAIKKGDIPPDLAFKIADATPNGGWKIKDNFWQEIGEDDLDFILQTISKLPDTRTTAGGGNTNNTRTIYRTSPLTDFFDTIYLYMVFNSYFYLQKGYSQESVMNITYFTYMTTILPILRELLTMKDDGQEVKLTLRVSLPYKFLKGISPTFRPPAIQTMFDTIYRREPFTAQTLPALKENIALIEAQTANKIQVQELLSESEKILKELQFAEINYITYYLFFKLSLVFFDLFKKGIIQDDIELIQWFQETIQLHSDEYGNQRNEYNRLYESLRPLVNKLKELELVSSNTANQQALYNRLLMKPMKQKGDDVLKENPKVKRINEINSSELQSDFEKCYTENTGIFGFLRGAFRDNDAIIECYENLIENKAMDYINELYRDEEEIRSALITKIQERASSNQEGGLQNLRKRKTRSHRTKQNRTRKLLKNKQSR